MRGPYAPLVPVAAAPRASAHVAPRALLDLVLLSIMIVNELTLGAEYNMDSQSKEAQGQGVKKLAKQHLTKKQGVEGGQALRRAQHLTNPSEETHRQRCKHSQLINNHNRQ